MKYKGFTAIQAACNNHIMIHKGGVLVAHVNCTEKKSKKELRNIIDSIIKMRE